MQVVRRSEHVNCGCCIASGFDGLQLTRFSKQIVKWLFVKEVVERNRNSMRQPSLGEQDFKCVFDQGHNVVWTVTGTAPMLSGVRWKLCVCVGPLLSRFFLSGGRSHQIDLLWLPSRILPSLFCERLAPMT